MPETYELYSYIDEGLNQVKQGKTKPMKESIKSIREKMTDEEAEYWDEYYTKNTIMPDTSKPGFFARKYGMTVKLSPEATCLLAAQAETTHRSFSEIIDELVREKIAVSV